MNKKLLLLILLLAAVLLGSSAAYNGLKDQVQPQTMATAPTTEPTQPTAAETTETEPQETTAETQSDEEEEAQPGPDFLVYDAQGEPVQFSDLRGKPVIINFWATWCGYCVEEMPDFQKVYEEYGDQIHFMMINVTDGYQETQEKAAAFIEKKGFTFPVYYDLDLSAANTYRVNAMPVTYLFDENGVFVAWQQGALNEEILRIGVDLLLETEE